MPPQGTVLGSAPGGGQAISIGNAIFTIQANPSPFVNAMLTAKTSAQQFAVQASGDLRRGTSHAALGFLELSRAVEDAQYGFRSIVNNIPQMVMLFGGSAGIAGAISIASVGVNQLVQHWGYLTDAFQAAWAGSTLEQLQQIRTRAEEAAEAFEKLSKAPTEMAAKGGKQLAKAMVEGDLGKWLEAVTSEVGKNPALATSAKEAAMAMDPGEFMAKGPEAIAPKIQEMNRKKASELLGQAQEPGAKGDAARKILGGMNLPPEMMGAIQAADPAAQQRQADFEKQQKVQKEVQKRIADQEKKHEQDREKELANAHRLQQEHEAREKKAEAEAEAEAKKDAHDQQALERKERHLRWQVQDIMKAGRPERAHAQFMGFGEFARSTQLGILNNPADIAKKQLDQLERIRRLLEDNPAQKQLILNAVAAGPP